MNEENILKQKYNELLARYKKGAEYLVSHPEDADKANAELNRIETELSKIIEALPDMTDEEKTNGFKIEENIPQPSKDKNDPLVDNLYKPVDNLETQSNSNVVSIPQSTPTVVSIPQSTALSNFTDNWKMATQLAKSSLLPDEFKNHPENVVIALGMAQKMNMDPFTICQNLHIIRGKLSWSGSFCKSLIEQSGKYTDLDFVYFGEENTDERGCYLEATRVRDGKRIQGNKVTIKMAKDEKWYTTNTKWRTMTDQMLGYRAAAFFARLYCGEMLNGIMTSEENVDMDCQKPQPTDILG